MNRNRTVTASVWMAAAALLTGGPGVQAAAPPPTTSPAVQPLWRDPSQPAEARVKNLVSLMTLQEKISQLQANPPAIPRLGIHAYSHRNECLHGLISGNATIFPQAIGMAATWDTALIHDEADVISTEARAKHSDYVARHHGDSGEQVGLNFYAPNINIFRDPRWGRGQETYGEDPFLTGQLAVAFIRGLQGNDPHYVKAIACVKHFAVHSGPESQRHRFDAEPTPRDLYDTYLPAFEAAVREGHVGSVMGAYSALDGTPDCANSFLLTKLLRNTWGFGGVVFSDGGAIGDVWAAHHYVPTPEQAAAAAVKAGCDISSGGMGKPNEPVTPELLKGGRAFSALNAAVKDKLVSESDIDTAVSRELLMRFRLGLFDPPSVVPWSNSGIDQTDTAEHRALALKVAQESIVLLKNDGLLPLNRARIRQIAVIGPNADSLRALTGNYSGRPSHATTILQGIREVAGAGITVDYISGPPLAVKNDRSNWMTPEKTIAQATVAAQKSDVVIYVGGLDASLEKEQGRDSFEGFDQGDRTKIEVPAPQEQALQALVATGKPVVFVNCSGGAIAMPWEAEHVPAIVQAWYPGEDGGRAVAQVLFGDIDPAGRLPITFYASTADLPPFADYSMANRTYRYFAGKPLFAFGHGLSYTTFEYSSVKAEEPDASGVIHLSFDVKNTGTTAGDEVTQVYVAHSGAATDPKQSLCAFARIHLAAGNSQTVSLRIPVGRFRHWSEEQKQYVIDTGTYQLRIGGASDDIRLQTSIDVRSSPDEQVRR